MTWRKISGAVQGNTKCGSRSSLAPVGYKTHQPSLRFFHILQLLHSRERKRVSRERESTLMEYERIHKVQVCSHLHHSETPICCFFLFFYVDGPVDLVLPLFCIWVLQIFVLLFCFLKWVCECELEQ